MRKVLIISPHFPPVNAPDHQRVRMSLPYFREFGWEPHVLAVKPENVEGATIDPNLEKTYPSDIVVDRVGALSVKATRIFAVGGLGFRALSAIRKAGDRLLQTGTFDLVYFSTTVFLLMTLGPRWKKRFDVPYMLDFQDPWLNDYYNTPQSAPPPGGRLKYGITHLIAKKLEPSVVRRAAAIVTVSPRYPEMLRARYPGLRRDLFTVLPFGAPERDFENPDPGISQNIFSPEDGLRHWVYVGVAGRIMWPALRILFSALQKGIVADPEKFRCLRMHFVGTSYSATGPGEQSVLPIAAEFGVQDLVTERTSRVPYFEALKILTDSDAILMIGSDNPGYTASKIFPCVLARRPLLGIFHEESSVVQIMRECRAGKIITFRPEQDSERVAEAVKKEMISFLEQPRDFRPETNWETFSSYTAREMTRRQCAVFEQAVQEVGA